MNSLNPNFVVLLHFLGKLLWILLAAFFGYVGLELYKMGLAGGTEAAGKFVGIEFTLSNAGPGLVVMVIALICCLIGAVRAKIVMDGDSLSMMHKVPVAELRPAGPEVTKPFDSTDKKD